MFAFETPFSFDLSTSRNQNRNKICYDFLAKCKKKMQESEEQSHSPKMMLLNVRTKNFRSTSKDHLSEYLFFHHLSNYSLLTKTQNRIFNYPDIKHWNKWSKSLTHLFSVTTRKS